MWTFRGSELILRDHPCTHTWTNLSRLSHLDSFFESQEGFGFFQLFYSRLQDGLFQLARIELIILEIFFV